MRNGEVQEDAPFKAPSTAGQPQQHTSDDISSNFVSHLAHSKDATQAEVLSILFGMNWEDPHTAEEISAAYVGADSNTRKEIDDALDHQMSDLDVALQPHNHV